MPVMLGGIVGSSITIGTKRRGSSGESVLPQTQHAAGRSSSVTTAARSTSALPRHREPGARQHADRLERMLDEHGPGEAEVALFLNDDMYLRSYNHARLVLGIPLPPLER